MYMVITGAAAAVFVVLFRALRGRYRLAIPCFVFLGATLMWAVDHIIAYAQEGELPEFTADAAALGVVVVLCGLAVWGAALWIGRAQAARASRRI